MVCMAHRLQCKTPHFPKHKFCRYATQNVQTHLKSTVIPNSHTALRYSNPAQGKGVFIGQIKVMCELGVRHVP